MGNLKNFVGEHAYNIIKNIAVDNDRIRRALVTPQNARAVFSELTEFEMKSLCAEISGSETIGQIKETTQQEIVDAFNAAGYDKVIFDDEEAIAECEKYYDTDEVICTYKDLKSRMRKYHMVVAIKANIEKIERSKIPSREDEYGTSILNIQIARNGSHMSIKNRYNHTVSQPDSTLNNNLDTLCPGLQSMVLGYYGFASSNKTKSHYDNIINIGEVYLKYHTERNNVYFGAFVLDSVNGVRFFDTSRYYVTKGTAATFYNREHPLVLDFQDKKVIDLLNSNGKAPLLSRALQEGILTSANKDESDTLVAVFYDAKKELLASRKKALQYVHKVYGYDFTKPHTVTGMLGTFTAKSIKKITGSNTGVLLVCLGSEMKVCEMNHGAFNVKDLACMYDIGIEKFYRRGDFETARKSGNMAVYVIQQDKQYIGKPKLEEKRSYYYSQNVYNPKIDKSGFNITEAREKLFRRLQQYKREKRAREAAEIDYTHDVFEIKNSFTELKRGIIELLERADTVNDFNILGRAINYNLTCLVRDIKDVEEHAANKNFSSVKSAYQAIDDIKAKIADIKSKLYDEDVA